MLHNRSIMKIRLKNFLFLKTHPKSVPKLLFLDLKKSKK